MSDMEKMDGAQAAQAAQSAPAPKSEKTEKSSKSEKKDKSAKKGKDKKTSFSARVSRWFREMRSELKKVIWPTPKQIGKNTLVALVMMAASAILLGGFDWLASAAVNALITLVG